MNKKIKCPTCGWLPTGQSYWVCDKCGEQFDTFKTKAKCSNKKCECIWEWTQCPSCRIKNLHDDWYQ